jgi:hypothetical protein
MPPRKEISSGKMMQVGGSGSASSLRVAAAVSFGIAVYEGEPK